MIMLMFMFILLCIIHHLATMKWKIEKNERQQKLSNYIIIEENNGLN